MSTTALRKEARRVDARFAVPAVPLSLVGVALLACLLVALASLRHTGSLAFPIDDGYIYSNYVLSAARGHFFTYNPGETSGGITGLGWYALCTLFYLLLTPFHSLLGVLAPRPVQSDAALAAQAGHLYLAAYLPGMICLALTGLGVYNLAKQTFPSGNDEHRLRDVFCWVAAAAACIDAGLVWGAMSGLEVSLSCALAVWAIVALIEDARNGVMRRSLLLASFLPFARPDLLVVGLMGAAWLVLRVLYKRSSSRFRQATAYLIAVAAGAVAMSLVYFVGWGRPLPSSFDAKVGGLRLGARFFSAGQELVLAGQWQPFLAAVLALAGGVMLARNLFTKSPVEHEANRPMERSWAGLLVLMTALVYVAAIMLTLPWFGQEQRYLLPVHPFAIVLLAGLTWVVARAFAARTASGRSIRVAYVAVCGTIAACLLLMTYVWATQNYAVEVRNIEDAHVLPALWLAANTPRDAVVASEPIGAVKLFSRRRTVDLVGLTTPATLGTYRNWPLAWKALREEGAGYLLFYPRWFDNARPPAWALETQRYTIPDNRIAGDNLISIYRLDWSRAASLQVQAAPDRRK